MGDPFISVSFNQDGTALAGATRAGLRAYSVGCGGAVAEVVREKEGERRRRVVVSRERLEAFASTDSLLPFPTQLRHESTPPAGYALAAMLFRTNVFALVGGGPTPATPPHRVLVWDGAARQAAGELSFRSAVTAVALRRDAVAVALAHRSLLYSLSDLRLVAAADTGPNNGGALALASGPRRVFAAPAPTRGAVRVEHVDAGRSVFVAAHTSRVAALVLSADGGLLATVSARGTTVRVHRTDDGARIAEFRRGADPALPRALVFGPCGGGSGTTSGPLWLAAASDKGTAHLFWVGPPKKKRAADCSDAASPSPSTATPASRAAASARALATRLAPSLTAPRSVASFKLPPGSARGCALAFSPDGREVRVASVAGGYAAHAVPTGPDGGEGALEVSALDMMVLPAAT